MPKPDTYQTHHSGPTAPTAQADHITNMVDDASQAIPARESEIIDVSVIVCCPGRNFVTVKILTRSGVYGIGDATLNGREMAVVSYLRDHVAGNLIGRDARNIEDIWQFLYRGAYWRRGPVTMRAIAAIDMALWDIKGKILNTPVYNLLGGRSRDRVLVYGHANGQDIEQTLDEVTRYSEMGYKAIRAQTGLPGVRGAYGVGRGKMYYEPAHSELPEETQWSTSKYLNYIPKLMEKIRDTLGYDLALLHDVHHRLTPIEAARLGKSLEPYALFWMEDACPAENQDVFKVIRSHTTTPLAVGEVFNTLWDCKDLIQNQLIDFIRMSVLGAGGLTHIRRVADFAAVWQIRTGCHGATDLSPVTMSAALHYDSWVPNFGIQEYMRHTEETDEVFQTSYHFEDGYLILDDQPGLGVDIDEECAARFPYKPKQLPVARLEDGTMWNW